MIRFKLRLSWLAVMILLASGCVQPLDQNAAGQPPSVVDFGEFKLNVDLAVSQAEQSKGLAGVSSLADDQGMLFVFSDKDSRTFWMKNMLIPIDIIWIEDARIVGIAHQVPVPLKTISNTDLPVYRSPSPVNYVLEVRAGLANEKGIAVGGLVEIK
jgi:uncharacterized protein